MLDPTPASSARPAGDDLTATSHTIATTPDGAFAGGPRVAAALRRLRSPRRVAGAPPSDPHAPPVLPARLGRYDFARLNRRLGAGGMGQVWLAWDEVLQVERAVKLPSERFAQDPRWREEMLREARVLAQLTHPGAARFYEFVSDGERCGLVMEFVRGRTLRELLSNDGPPAVPESIRICRAVAEAIEAAHRHPMRIAHCDLKPANVMVADDGTIKVLDWGIAQREQRPDDAADGAAGTPGYIAPEVVLGGAHSGRAADLFALGALLFECLCGSRAFPGEHADDRLRQTIYAEPEWARLPPATPSQVRILLRRLLEKNPRLRLVDVGEAVASLAEHHESGFRAPAVANNLPVPVSTFIGRDRELAELRARLGASRAVVVLGLGGIGKTALALHEAGRLADDPLIGAFRDGFWLARLGSLEDPSLLAETIARAVPGCVGIGPTAKSTARGAGPDPSSDVASGGTHDAARLASCLADRSMLLLLDGCEHLAADTARLCRVLLERCSGVRIVATSRVPLDIPGASQLRLGPLSTTPTPSRATADRHADGSPDRASDAARLFIDSAQRVLHDFAPTAREQETIGLIVTRLDGIPLAIEIAAAWLGRCELSDLLRNLEERPAPRVISPPSTQSSTGISTGTSTGTSTGSSTGATTTTRLSAAPERMHGAGMGDDALLESMVEGSVSQLPPKARSLLARLAIFGGGWTMSAAEQVCVDPSDGLLSADEVPALLGELVDRSLVEFERVDGARRYRMLRPVLAAARRVLALDAGEAKGLSQRHRQWCQAFTEELLGEASLPDPGGGRTGRLLHEWPNLRKALVGALADDAVDDAAMLALRLHRPLYSGGLHREGATILERILERCDERPEDRAGATLERRMERALSHAQLCNAAGVLRWQAGELDRAERHLLEAEAALVELLSLCGGAPDSSSAPGPPSAPPSAPPSGQLSPAPSTWGPSLQAKRTRAQFGRVGVRINRGLVAKDRPDAGAALRLFSEARELAVGVGHEAGVAQADVNAAVLLQEIGRGADAEVAVEAWLTVLSSRADLAEFHAEALAVRGLARLDRGELDGAGEDLGRALASARRLDTIAKLPLRLWWIASLADRTGRDEEGAVLRLGARRLARSLGVHEPHLRRADDDGTLDRIRRRLGPAAFAAAQQRSDRLGLAELCEIADRVTAHHPESPST